MNFNNWTALWQNPYQRNKFIFVTLGLLVLLILMPFIFAQVQAQNGIRLQDSLLDFFPVYNLSWPIFICIYGLGLLAVYRVCSDPIIFYNVAKAYIILSVLRFTCMFAFPLEPPLQMVELKDPITSVFYGGDLITKDLFFSGHTSTMFIIYLCLYKPTDKFIALIISIIIGLAVLIQRVHYIADVIAAYPITYFVWRFTKNW